MSFHSSRQPAEYKVFVAGLPSSLKYKYVLKFFSQVGPVVRIEPVSRLPNEAFDLEGHCKKGCCIVVTSCPSTLDRLIGSRCPKLLGRSLICKKYLEKRELEEHNRRTNLQRVLLKRVSAHISEEQLFSFLSLEFGKVLIIYPFKTQKCQDQYVLEKNPKNRLTYSVTFEDPLISQKLSKLGQIAGPDGSIIEVLPFQHLGRLRRPVSLVDPLSVSGSKSAVHKLQTELSLETRSNYLMQPSGFPATPQSSSRTVDHHPTTYRFEYNRKPRLLSDVPQAIKPTSAKYHSVPRLFESQSKNLRMNICRSK